MRQNIFLTFISRVVLLVRIEIRDFLHIDKTCGNNRIDTKRIVAKLNFEILEARWMMVHECDALLHTRIVTLVTFRTRDVCYCFGAKTHLEIVLLRVSHV
jgi:hypothetical protein